MVQKNEEIILDYVHLNKVYNRLLCVFADDEDKFHDAQKNLIPPMKKLKEGFEELMDFYNSESKIKNLNDFITKENNFRGECKLLIIRMGVWARNTVMYDQYGNNFTNFTLNINDKFIGFARIAYYGLSEIKKRIQIEHVKKVIDDEKIANHIRKLKDIDRKISKENRQTITNYYHSYVKLEEEFREEYVSCMKEVMENYKILNEKYGINMGDAISKGKTITYQNIPKKTWYTKFKSFFHK